MTIEHDFNLDSLYQEAMNYEMSLNDDFGQAFLSLIEDKEKYIFKEVIGQGGMKKVNRVYDSYIRRDVALATLKNNHSKQLFDTFIYEAWLTAKLDHPNIIKIYDLGVTRENSPFFTMDLKTGSTLEDALKNSALSINDKLEIFIKICDAISYAHSKKILHLDLKPQNIQIGEFGEVIVCDWGLGKILPSVTFSEESQNLEHIFLDAELILQTDNENTGGRGTPGFMAPEQVLHGKKKTRQTDIYGLGALLYYILTLRKPIGGTVEHIFQCTISGELAPISSELPESLAAVILKAMSTVPTKRYPTVKNLRTDVHNFMTGYSTCAEDAGFVRESMLFFRRNRTICLVLIFSSLTMLSLSGLFIYRLENSRRDELQAKNEAKENLNVANTSMTQLKQTIKLYEGEKQAYTKLMGNYENVFYAHKSYWDKRKFFSNPYEEVKSTLQKVDVILSRNPDDKRALSDKSLLLFISGNYSMASEIIESKNIKGLECISATVKKMKLHYEKRQNIWEFIKVIDFFIERGQQNKPSDTEKLILSKLITYDHAIRTNRKNYVEIVKKLLIYINPGWENKYFKYDWKIQKLTLRGKGLEHIAMMLDADDSSILRFIPLKSLDVSQTNFYDTRELSTLFLTSLDLSNTRVDSLEIIRRFPHLKQFIMHKDQFSPDQLKVFFKHVQIEVVPNVYSQ